MKLTKLRNRSGGRRRTSPLAGTKALPGRSRVKLAKPVPGGIMAQSDRLAAGGRWCARYGRGPAA
jgi:hypothetical protein